MQILLIMLIVVLLAFSVLLLALAKQSPREKQTEDKEQEEYIRDYAETVRQTGGSMKKLEHWKVIAIYSGKNNGCVWTSTEKIQSCNFRINI